MSDNGKGSAPRPFSVDDDTFTSNHERTFGKRPPKTPYKHPLLPDPDERDDHKTTH